jgi:hypothetical protein
MGCESSDGINREIVQNITGRECCPACVEYLGEYKFFILLER